jgi:succinate dehydrogenase/fumarate reductase-like Fe-S protein
VKIHAAAMEALKEKGERGENRRKLNLPKQNGAFLCLLLSQLFRISCIKSCDTHDAIKQITLQIVRFEVEIRGG